MTENGCRIRLQQLLAIVIRKEGCRNDPGDFWMYENGYLLFQGLISSNSICWWNNGLNGATKNLTYHGYVNPGALLVGSEPCALEIIRNAWARRTLQPPPGYQIVALEDVESCVTLPVQQTQWTPLPEAVCSVVLRLSSQGRPAGLETIRESLMLAFPHVSPPSEQCLYDTLVQLTKEKKLYNTSNGYYIVTPEKRRSRSQSRGRKREEPTPDASSPKTMLMSTEEAMVMVHGDMETIRDGNITHQCIQTNLADVICGGNASDKILYPRAKRRSASFPAHRSPDRRGSFRLWSSSRRLRRSASTRTIAKHYIDTSSSTEYPNSGDSTPTPKKESLLSRLFRRSKRSQCQIGTFGAQFPPTEWFNSKAIHLHNVGTQTTIPDKENELNIAAYLETCDIPTSRSSTLPRNNHHHRRHLSTDLNYSLASRENSPISRFPSAFCTSTLPRKHAYRNRDKSCKSNRSTSDNDKTSHRINYENTVEAKINSSIDNSGPSSIESHKSSLTSGPSSLESHKTVINRNSIDSTQKIVEGKNKRKIAKAQKQIPQTNSSFTLQVTTNQNGVNMNNKINTTTTTAGSNTKIFVQNSPVRSVITFENGRSDPNNSVVIINGDGDDSKETKTKNTNQSLNNSRDKINEDLNNSRKLSLQLPTKESLNFNNLIKNNVNSNPDSPNLNKNDLFASTPPSPTNKSFEGISYIKNEVGTKSNIIGSEPNISYKENPNQQFPSLSDLTFNFTSLAAQKILKGVSINSVDTLVELNMAANVEKQNNCDVVHTDFGLF